MWVAAAIGMAVGFGFYLAAAVATGLVIFTFATLQTVEDRYLRNKNLS